MITQAAPNSILSHAIQQLSAPNWWSEPSAPWKSNRKKRSEISELRAKFLQSMSLKRKPETMDNLAKEHDVTIAKIRGLADPFIKSGKIIRGVNSDGKVTLEVSK